MITQLYISGHLGRGEDLTPAEDDASWATELCAAHDVTGLTLYSDGDFLTVLEGSPDGTLAVMQGVGKYPRINSAKIVLEEEQPAREFTQYSIGFRGVDYSAQNAQAFCLTLDSLARSLPDQPSVALQSLTSVFARVHNLGKMSIKV